MELLVLFILSATMAAIFMLTRRGASAWRRSINGNPTVVIRGNQLTVFPTGGGWKFSIGSPSGDDSPYFSDTYETEEAAKACGLAFLDGEPPPHASKKETREAAALDRAMQVSRSAPATYAETRAEIEAMQASGKYTLGSLRRIKKALSRVPLQLEEAYKEHYIKQNQEEADAVWALRKSFKSLEDAVDLLITWMETGGKSQRGEPPDIGSLIKRD